MLLHLRPRAVDRVLLRVQQVLHEQYELDLLPLVHAVARSILCRIEELELALPVTKHVRLQVRDLTDLANGEEFLYRLRSAHASCSARRPRSMSSGIARRAE